MERALARPAAPAWVAALVRAGGPQDDVPGWVHHTRRWRNRGDGQPLRRDPDDRLAGGIAAGIAAWRGFSPTTVRIVLAVAALISHGLGGAVLRPRLAADPGQGAGDQHRAAGRSTTRAAWRSPSRWRRCSPCSSSSPGRSTTARSSSYGWAQVFSVAGLTLIWRNAPDDERAGMRRLVQPLESLGGGSGTAARRATRLRIAGAAVLLAVGLGALLSLHGGTQLLAPLGGFLFVAAALVLLLGPWWLRIARDLVLERQARARAEERADIAAHMHDSVLQTLALIQRRAEDPQAVVQLARAQERELRSWLFEGRAPGDTDASSFAEGVRQIQRDVEARHGVPVEVVTVARLPARRAPGARCSPRPGRRP